MNRLHLHSFSKSSVYPYYSHTVMMSAEDIWRVNTLHDVISDFCVIYDTQLCQHLMDYMVKKTWNAKGVHWHEWGSQPNATKPPRVIWDSTDARLWCQASTSISMACEMSHKHTHSPGRFINVACNSKCKPDQVLITHFELCWVYWKFNQSAVKSFKLIPTGDRYLSSAMKATHYDRLLNQVIGTVTSNHCGFISNYNLIF